MCVAHTHEPNPKAPRFLQIADRVPYAVNHGWGSRAAETTPACEIFRTMQAARPSGARGALEEEGELQ